MNKIFRYELKRLLWNKFFAGILAVALFYGWQVLYGETISGVAHTAPFSPWSFGSYLSRVLPLLWVGALFFLTFFTSGAARRTSVLTAAAPMPAAKYALARCAAALAATAALAAAVLALAAAFYGRYFGWYHWGSLLPVVGAVLAPPLVFALGTGWLLGQLRPWLIYVWMIVPFATAALPLPQALSMWNGALFAQLPLQLGVLDPAFSLPAGVWVVQAALLAGGVLALSMACRKGPRRHTAPVGDKNR